MLLQRLCEYSERIESTPAMYQSTPIRWIIHLDRNGKLLGFVPTDDGSSGKKSRGKKMLAPYIGRAYGIRAKLLADTGEYVLGIPRENSDPQRIEECNRAFRKEVQNCAEQTREAALKAVVKFLDSLPLQKKDLPDGFNAGDTLTFQVERQLPMDLASVRKYWGRAAAPDAEGHDADVQQMECLICGKFGPAVKRLPFKIKGIPGGQTSGTALISANSPAFESYGLEASLIAPTCQECGERFSKAANALIENRQTRIGVGPLVYIFWTREEVGFNPASMLREPDPGEVRALIESGFSGKRADADETAFYAAALSASGARVSVRDWLDTTVATARRNLARFFSLQELVERDGSAGKPYGIYALAAATVRDAAREMAPNTPKVLLHAALKGGPLPMWLLHQAVKRSRAEQDVTRNRAALIKMVLLSHQQEWRREDSLTQLDTSSKEPAYLCGRLLGVLESVQERALPGLNTTITDRFFGTASSAPASVFARLLRGAQPHLAKLRKEHRGTYEALQKRLEEVLQEIGAFPRVLTLEDQGRFSLGYYHQRAADRAAAIAYKQARQKAETSSEGNDN